ncbi:MAG: hypothetical protein A2Z29_09735 [Chloroflexi bacterium RBG_16_56_11]|nr:MAG: hypothetical protein A2Z29_09735 [Chloroflexi bacterium RBG_16_56_11]
MACRLADRVRVRKESWGLLFYLPARHRVCFVKSRDWLYPRHFDGTWTPGDIAADVARRTALPVEKVERCLYPLTDRLKKDRVITDEVR